MPTPSGSQAAGESSNLHFQWILTVPELLRLGRDWDRMLSEWEVDCTFLRWDWIRAWLRVFPPGGQLLVGVLRSGTRTLGLAPLYLAREKISPLGPVLRSLRLLGDGLLCPDHLVLPVAKGHEEVYARLLVGELQRRESTWDVVELRDLLETHPAWKQIEASARAAGYEPSASRRTHCPYLRLPATWEEFLTEMDKDDRKQLNYRFRRVERELGPLQVLEPRSIAEVDAFMTRLETLHTRSWRTRGRPGVFVHPRFRLFHRLHARRSFRAGRLMLIGLWAGEHELAAALGFRRQGAAEGYQFGYDPEQRGHGPGTLLVFSVIRRAIEGGLEEMDMLRGSGEYKYKMTQEERRGIDLVLSRGTLPDRAASMAKGTRLLAGRMLRSVLDRRRLDWIKRRLRMDS